MFIDVAAHEVYKTLAEAIVLVLVVIWLFLGSLRSGAGAGGDACWWRDRGVSCCHGVRLSINLPRMLALVLSIGSVVDECHRRLRTSSAAPTSANWRRLASCAARAMSVFAVLATTAVLVAGVPAHRLPRGQQRPPVPRARGGAGRRGRDFLRGRASRSRR